ncbi:MAG TPA: hypothetical protein VF069_18720 [Streptosporangiaceae bacterium]
MSTLVTTRKSRRAMLAEVVLLDLPTPESISLWESGEAAGLMALSFGSAYDDGARWAEHFAVLRAPQRDQSVPPRVFLDHGQIRWHGWAVQLTAYKAAPLDADEQARLIEIANE